MLQSVDLSLPDLPGKLQGFRIAHLTDLHIRGRRRRHRHILELLAPLRLDLVLLTGDYISEGRFAPAALPVMREMTAALRSRLGIFGVFGNHDTAELRAAFNELPVTWLDNKAHVFDHLPLDLLGFEMDRYTDPDAVATLEHLHGQHAHRAARESRDREGADLSAPPCRSEHRLRLLLSHRPAYLPVAADMGVHIMFSGHTHGGQMRLPGRIAFFNSSDYPMRLTSGVLRLRDTLGVVSRGLGEIHLPVRTFCPPQLPVYTLRRGPMPGQRCEHVVNALPW